MIGATITVPGTSLGEATDASGNFVLNVTPGTERVVVSFIGYKDVVVDIAKGKSTKLGTITLVTDSKMLDDVVVTQSIAVQRKTPVAVASVDFDYIEEKLGGQEFPEVLKSTLAYTPPRAAAATATRVSTCAVSSHRTSQ